MDLDDKKHTLGIIINNLANAASAAATACTKLSGLGMDGETVAYLADTAKELETLKSNYRSILGELPADDRQS